MLPAFLISALDRREFTVSRKLYRVSQEERSIFCEVIVTVNLSKQVYMYMWPIPNGFRDRAISLCSTVLYTVQTSNTPCPHTSCKGH
jgi:hypothetical protein